MADRAEVDRSNALRNFTRNLNTLNDLFEDSAVNELVTPQYEKVKQCFEKLEDAHDRFISVVDISTINLETDDKGFQYIDEANGKYNEALKKYSSYLKTTDAVLRDEAEQKEKAKAEAERETQQKLEEDRAEKEQQLRKAERHDKFVSAAAELRLALESFTRVNTGFDSSLGAASLSDKRKEWNRIQSEFSTLKEQVIVVAGIDPSEDMTVINQKFAAETEKSFVDAKKWFLTALKDDVQSSPTLTPDPSPSHMLSSTKKEPVKLPKFEGALSASPFLKFPVWIERWEKLIVKYEEDWRPTILLDYLDDVAKEKFVGYESNYPEAIKRLKKFYADPRKVVSCVMKEVLSAEDIKHGDYSGLLSYVDVLEKNYNRLSNLGIEHEMSNTSTMSVILRKFPRAVAEKWVEHLSGQGSSVQERPFPEFMVWVISMRFIWEQMANVKSSNAVPCFFDSTESGDVRKVTCYECKEEGHKRSSCPKLKNDQKKKPRGNPVVKKFWCALHKGDKSKSCWSASCTELRQLTDANKRVQLLLENRDCQYCCGDHKSDDCKRKDRVCGGGKPDRGCKQQHKLHELFCAAAKVFHLSAVHSVGTDYDEDDEDEDGEEGVLLLIMQVRVSRKVVATVFFDIGSTANFIREAFAKMQGYKGRKKTLSVTTLGGVVTDHYTVIQYSGQLRALDGTVYEFKAFGMENITGALSVVGIEVIRELFPDLDDGAVNSLRRTQDVDILIGAKHPSWHPKIAEPAHSEDGDLWLYRGLFGVCLGGRHPFIREETRRSDALFHVNHVHHSTHNSADSTVSHELEFCPDRITQYRDPNKISSTIPDDSLSQEESSQSEVLEHASAIQADPPVTQDVQCFGTKTKVLKDAEMFFELENLGVMIDPKCGGCQCSNCPVLGSKYSFSEQKQYDIIQSNLFYDDHAGRWVTEYPWNLPRGTLPKNYKVALQNLHAMEKRLAHDKELAQDFCNQIQDMVDRGAAVVLSEEEIAAWEGDYYYLALVGIKGKKKWLRICFDASRKQGGRYSMNDCLYKGPDRFMNNLLSVCLGFRNGRVAAAADLSKFHNQVQLVPADIHMQRFLWRGMRTDEQPQTLAVVVNNFGVKPANCIATSALHKSADLYENQYPEACQAIKEQTYIDDELVAAENEAALHQKTNQMDEITTHAGMKNKGWTYSGDETCPEIEIVSEVGDAEEEKVLGLLWDPKTDTFKFQAKLKLKINLGNHQVDITISSEDELNFYSKDVVLTRRIVLANVMKVFDPIGLLSPIILRAKLLLRETWNVEGLGWDDLLPRKQTDDWIAFLKSLLELNDIEIPRSLWPEGEVDGLPDLIVFSDGSITAFGAAAYIRWKMEDGTFWSRLIMAKSKLAPKLMISIPRIELSGAAMGNRLKNFLLKDTSLKFGKVLNLVDSSTVLGYLHKESSNFKQFEGIKIAEIQSTNEFKDGKLVAWGWVPGSENPADWCTKSRTTADLMNNELFLTGPAFLVSKEEDWPVKYTFRTDKLEGESVHFAVSAVVSSTYPDIVNTLAANCSYWIRVVRAMAWWLRLVPVNRRPSGPLSYDEVKAATTFIVKEVQKCIESELLLSDEGKGRFRKLAPLKDEEGVWRVGSRMRNHVVFTADGKMPKILPTYHRVTLLIMRYSHQFSHAGLDGTLSRFYAKGFWTVRAGHIARTVKNQCVTCRKIAKITIEQPLGEHSFERLTMLYAWGFCQLDLFGPFSCRGDVNPKTTKKTWAIIIEDANSGAVHLDIVQDYSTQAVLFSLRRFGALRGWPGIICSDPGSQLESASGKLENWWLTMGTALRTLGSEKNFRWDVSPADSPWRQGKAERRIGVVKRLLKLSVGDTRVTPVELQTILFECANICNERPIGASKPREDGTYSLITPNQLIHGRSMNVLPDDVELADELPVKSRYRIIQHVTTSFWNRWSSEVSPGLVHRQKWHRKGHNLRTNDVVMICETTKLKGKYRLAIVEEVFTSNDGRVRSAIVRYSLISTSPKGKETVKQIRVKRSVQRLSLILPIEEQSSTCKVEEHEHSVSVKAE